MSDEMQELLAKLSESHAEFAANPTVVQNDCGKLGGPGPITDYPCRIPVKPLKDPDVMPEFAFPPTHELWGQIETIEGGICFGAFSPTDGARKVLSWIMRICLDRSIDYRSIGLRHAIMIREKVLADWETMDCETRWYKKKVYAYIDTVNKMYDRRPEDRRRIYRELNVPYPHEDSDQADTAQVPFDAGDSKNIASPANRLADEDNTDGNGGHPATSTIEDCVAVEPIGVTASPDGSDDVLGPPHPFVFTSRHADFLQAAFILKAFDKRSRRSSREITLKVDNCLRKGAHKTASSELKSEGYLESSGGRRGGYWLTEKGKKYLEMGLKNDS